MNTSFQAPPWLKRSWSGVKRFIKEWSKDNTSLLAAGVAFYATFSLAPLLTLLLFAGSLFLDDAAARQQLVDSAARFFSPRTADAIGRLAVAVQRERSSGITILSVALLIVSASAMFRHLRAALDIVMDVPSSERAGWMRFLLSRAVAVVMVVCVVLFLLMTVVVTSALSAIHEYLPELAAGDIILWRTIDFAVSTLLLAIVFAATLRYVPDVRLQWRHVAKGAATAAICFTIGRYLLALLLSKSHVSSSYGAAASLAIVLVAIYFAALTLFVGAEITELTARRDGEFLREREERRNAAQQPPRK